MRRSTLTVPSHLSLGPLVLLLILANACAQQRERPMGPGPGGMLPDLEEKRFIHASGVGGLEGFSQAVKVGKRIYLSGQVGVDSTGEAVGNDVASQAGQAFRNIAAVLLAAGATPQDVVSLDVYVVGLKEGDVARIREAGSAFFPAARQPVGSVMGIQSLPVPGLLISINAIAETRGLFPDREALRRYQQ
ncbi:MAG: RidA family protein [Gemmatimonadota bacterium]